MKYFISDLHLGHNYILKHDDRPFKDLNTMENEFVKRINSNVHQNDYLYIIGDIAFRVNQINKIDNFISRLNCKNIILILGNHDKFNPFKYVEIGIQSVHTSLFIENEEFCLIHDPAICSGYPNQKFICGHVHKLFKKVQNVYNVSCCIHDYYPVSLDQIRQCFELEGLN